MLHPADEALASRDPGLAALRLLLDEQALRDWLGERLGTELCVRARYLRYKHATSCVLAADLASTGPVTRPPTILVTAYAASDLAKMVKTVERAPSGSVLAVDRVRGLVATAPAADRHLPALAVLDDEQRRTRLLRHLLGDGPGRRHATVRTLRHKPQRRWVGLVRPRRAAPAVVRAYRRSDLRAAVDAIGAWTHADLRTPRMLGVAPRLGAVAVEYVEGRTLHEHARRDETHAVAAFAGAGEALARLHGCHHVALRARAADESSLVEATAVRATARQLQVLLPEIAEDVADLTRTVTARLVPFPAARAVHGDFSADQVVVGQDGRVTLIDLDSAHWGDPAQDLACAAAVLQRDLVLGEGSPDRHRAWLAALHEGYLGAAPLPDEDRLATHAAAHLLRRAVEPFRLRTGDWPVATRGLVALSRAALSSPATPSTPAAPVTPSATGLRAAEHRDAR